MNINKQLPVKATDFNMFDNIIADQSHIAVVTLCSLNSFYSIFSVHISCLPSILEVLISSDWLPAYVAH